MLEAIIAALAGAAAGGAVDYFQQRQREKKALFVTVRRVPFPPNQGAAYLQGTVTNIGEKPVIIEKVELRGYGVEKVFSEGADLSILRDSANNNQYTLGSALEPGKGFAYTLVIQDVEQELFDSRASEVTEVEATVIFKSLRPRRRYRSDPVMLEPTDYR